MTLLRHSLVKLFDLHRPPRRSLSPIAHSQTHALDLIEEVDVAPEEMNATLDVPEALGDGAGPGEEIGDARSIDHGIYTDEG